MIKEYEDYCMNFSNEELKKDMIEYLVNHSWNSELIRCLSREGSEIDPNSLEHIETIVFDGKDENLCISFLGIHTSIFAYDLEMMFIDEYSKGIYTSSDVYDNVVYEGNLRTMSHKELLQMFSEIVLCFMDATDVSVTQSDVPENKYKKYNYYEPHAFIVDVQSNHLAQKANVYGNITIKY